VAGRVCLALAAAAVLLAATACAGSAGPGATPRPGSAVQGKLIVFAASSLTDAFNEVAAAFEARHPGTQVQFNFAGSPTLRAQLEQGARADVFASADTIQMGQALQSGVVASAGQVFARNSLVIIMPAANNAAIASPGDLARSGLKLVLANPDVPVGGYTRQMLQAMDKDPALGSGFSARVLKNVVSNESNVKQVVAKVQLGEADAGVVYATDVTPSLASSLKQVTVPAQFNVVADYPIALVKGSRNPRAGQAFIDFVLGADGQGILKKYGFTGAS
jgi:molybdate transport system substrate-binding protein